MSMTKQKTFEEFEKQAKPIGQAFWNRENTVFVWLTEDGPVINRGDARGVDVASFVADLSALVRSFKTQDPSPSSDKILISNV